MRSRLQPNVVEAATLYGSSRCVARCALPLLTPPYIPLHPLTGGVARCDGACAFCAGALRDHPSLGRCAATRARVGLWIGLGSNDSSRVDVLGAGRRGEGLRRGEGCVVTGKCGAPLPPHSRREEHTRREKHPYSGREEHTWHRPRRVGESLEPLEPLEPLGQPPGQPWAASGSLGPLQP